jgi:hypothetical protein
MRKLNKEIILNHYLFAALWTEELDSSSDVEDFMPSSVNQARKDIDSFLEKAKDFLLPYIKNFGATAEEQLGHDFWLSRNGHGSGFFDRNLEGCDSDVCDKLQDIARSFPTKNVFVNESELLFIE